MTTSRGLTWRLDRQYLVSGAATVPDVVGRLVAVPAWLGDAELAVGRRLADPVAGAVEDALAAGSLIKTFAFRGSTQLMRAEDAGTYLAVRCANRQWELASWREFYDLQPDDWPALRAAVREAVADGPLSREALVDAVTADRRFGHLRDGLSDPSCTLLKPLAWQGDLCLGPSRGGRLTLQSPTTSPGWSGLPDLDEAGHRAVVAYLGAYGPATRDNLHYWLVAGLSAGKRRLERWLDELVGSRVVEVDVDGRPMLALPEHVDEIRATEPSDAVVLLPGHDQWVLGPGTADASIVDPDRRAPVSRGANLVLRGGVLTGGWKVIGDVLSVEWFAEAGAAPEDLLADEVERLSGLLGRPLQVEVAAV